MGASAARITAADFLIPPELRDRSLAAEGSGRIGGLRLQLEATPRGTRLTDCYQQVPLRVLPPFQFGPGQPALLYLINPTAGLLDGDAQHVRLGVGRDTRAVVVGQSATRIHPCPRGFSTQQWNIEVASGAVLVLLPGPAIPFQDCRYYQRIAVHLEPGAGFIWGDIWLAGRYSRGEISERFRFSNILQEMAVYRSGRLAYRDRFHWRGPWNEETAAWYFAKEPACGALFVAGMIAGADLGMAAHFETSAGDLCYRWLGSTENVIATLTRTALKAAATLAGSPTSAPWLLEMNHLAPNHWFTLA